MVFRLAFRMWRNKKQDAFLNLISKVSITGIALGVMALIVVLSVMNGFQKEIRHKLFQATSHIEARFPDGVPYNQILKVTRDIPEIVAAAPFSSNQALVYGNTYSGALVLGIEIPEEYSVSDLKGNLVAGNLDDLNGDFNVAIGYQFAKNQGIGIGDSLNVISAEGISSIAGFNPRFRRFKVVAIFKLGILDFDSNVALISTENAAKLFSFKVPDRVRFKLDDLSSVFKVRGILEEKFPEARFLDWTQSNRNYFRAVEIEKRMMFVVLSFIIMVAAFNLISGMVMMVKDKSSDIAILKTLGVTPFFILKVFMVQGLISGILGTLSGLVLGIVVAVNIGDILNFFENLLGSKLFDASIYMVDKLPSEVISSDVVLVSIISLVLSFAATIYPSIKAGSVRPAEVLKFAS